MTTVKDALRTAYQILVVNKLDAEKQGDHNMAEQLETALLIVDGINRRYGKLTVKGAV